MDGVASPTAKLVLAIRCAKAAMLVSSLKHAVVVERVVSPGEEEDETTMKEIRDLRLKLARERFRSSQIQLCGSVELAILVTFLFMFLAALILLFKLVPL